MIRGIGILSGEDELPPATTDKKYQVWRLTAEQKDTPDQWELLTAETVEAYSYTETRILSLCSQNRLQ